LAIDPDSAQALDLLRTPGTEKMYLWDPGSGPGSGPSGLQIRIWKSAWHGRPRHTGAAAPKHLV
jgi:hypothetical protein